MTSFASTPNTYCVKRHAKSEFIPLRGQPYHVRTWGNPNAHSTPWVMLHGWMDVSASFQFLIDELESDPFIVAPDWRGFGLTQRPQQDHFWFPDYWADLDFLLDHLKNQFGHERCHLIGHSMGGNVVLTYAGIRPERVCKVVNIEGFGLPSTQAHMAPKRIAHWLDDLKRYHAGDFKLKAYSSLQGVVHRLQRNNPRLSQDKALWLAEHWSQADHEDQWHVLGHAAHKVINPYLYQEPEILAMFEAIQAPVLSLHASEKEIFKRFGPSYTFAQYLERMKSIAQVQHREVPNGAHMLHHDQPKVLAQLIESFFAESASHV